MEYSESEIEEIADIISERRLTPYMGASSEAKHDAIFGYSMSTAVAESFWTPIRGLELTLRNRVGKNFVRVYGPAWHEENAGIFQYQQMSQINSAKDKAAKKYRQDFVEELGLGFWAALFAVRYENMWRGCLRHVFGYMPRGADRSDVRNAVEKCRKFRNRIAHHEDISEAFSAAAAEEHFYMILETIAWMSPTMSKYIKAQSRVLDVLEKTENTKTLPS